MLRMIAITLILVLLTGCGVTRSSAKPVFAEDGSPILLKDGTPLMSCHTSTYTFAKDVSGARMICNGTTTGWSVDSSDPNAAIAGAMTTGMMQVMLPLALKGMAVP